MTMLVVCPACGGKLNAPEHLLGRMGKCPQCGKAIKITPSQEPAAAPAEPSAATRKVKPSAAKTQSEEPAIKVIHLDSRAKGAATSGGAPSTSRIALGLGIPSLVLGVIAGSFGWIPGVGVLSMPLSGLGLLLGIAGLIVAIVQRGRGLTFPIAGSAVCLASLAVGVSSLGFFSLSFRGLDTTKPTPVAESVANVKSGQNQEQPNVTPDKKQEWADASKGPVQHGDIRVQLGAVAVRNVRIRDLLGEETVSPTKNLAIQVLIDNASTTRKIDYHGWSGAVANPLALTDLLGGAGRGKSNALEFLTAPERNAASLTDNFKNEYKRLTLEPGAQLPGQVNTATSVYPGKQVEDLLVFEPPIPNVQYLQLKLPAAAFGGTGDVLLKIPKGMIQR